MGLLDNIGNKLSSMSDDDKRGMALNLASGFAGMSGNPNTNSIMAGIEGQRAALASRREKSTASDKLTAQTAQALKLLGTTYPDIAQAIQGGFMSPKEGMAEAMARRNAPPKSESASIEGYRLSVDQGFKGTYNDYILGQKSAGAPKTEVSYGGSSGAPAKAPDGMVNMTNIKTGIVTQVPIKGGVVDIDAQKQVTNANNALATIDSALNHAGLNASVGSIDSMFPSASPDAVAFEAYHDQIKGKAFLAAFESLKGGGQITEVEGLKAEQATARLNLAQDEEDYKQALVDLKGVINDVLERNQRVLSSIPAGDNNDPMGIRQE